MLSTPHILFSSFFFIININTKYKINIYILIFFQNNMKSLEKTNKPHITINDGQKYMYTTFFQVIMYDIVFVICNLFSQAAPPGEVILGIITYCSRILGFAPLYHTHTLAGDATLIHLRVGFHLPSLLLKNKYSRNYKSNSLISGTFKSTYTSRFCYIMCVCVLYLK